MEELHLHLFGCLTADDVWSLGKYRWQEKKSLLQWYADTFTKTYSRKPQWEQYWTSQEGLQLLKDDFLVKSGVDFPRFQASFNLIIALFKITPQDTEVLEFVLNKHRAEGYPYCEYRVIFPFTLSDPEVDEYFRRMCEKTVQFTSRTFKPRLLVSVARENPILAKQYAFLKDWLARYPHLAETIVGIDFCFAEEGHPPKGKREFFQKVHEDNAKNPEQALAILYHVGESFQEMSLASSARWVWEAQALGAHRLGHAIALGVDPALYIGKEVRESFDEQRDHFSFLLKHKDWLTDCGYQVRVDEVRKRIAAFGDGTGIHHFMFSEELAADTKLFQDALMKDLRGRRTIIESCPTSNIRIANLGAAQNHPLPRFVKNDLKAVVSTDDPGIFDITYEGELRLCEGLGIDRQLLLPGMNDRAEILSGRVS